MGQYHIISAPELKQAIYPFEVDSGLKAYEQIWSWGPRATFTLLMATGFGSGPRSLNWADSVGAWAGRRVSAAGDYAENTDMLNAPVFLENDSCDGQTKAVNKTSTRKINKSVAFDMLPVLERVGNVRRSDMGVDTTPSDKYSFWSFVQVAEKNGQWVIDAADQQTRDYYDRVATKDDQGRYLCERGPRPLDGAPDSLPAKSTNAPGLWVNLDRMEYVDASAFGENDLVDIVEGQSARAVMAMLFHHEARGGGDVTDYEMLHIVGRWRGDRIVLMGPDGIKKRWAKMDPSTVRATFTNITGLAQVFVDPDELRENKPLVTVQPNDMDGNAELKSDITRILLSDMDIRKVALDIKEPFYVEACGPARLHIQDKIYDVPPSVRIYTPHGGRLWVNADVEQALKGVLRDKPTKDLTMNENYEVVMENASEFEFMATSAHAVLKDIA